MMRFEKIGHALGNPTCIQQGFNWILLELWKSANSRSSGHSRKSANIREFREFEEDGRLSESWNSAKNQHIVDCLDFQAKNLDSGFSEHPLRLGRIWDRVKATFVVISRPRLQSY